MSGIIKGQEAVCPDGLGRVMDFGDDWIKIETYYDDRSCKWAKHNVTLISPFKVEKKTMKIKQILSQHRRDFRALYECEHCGDVQEMSGYDDSNFHDNVIPTFICDNCGKSASEDYRPLRPKHEEGVQL